MTDSTPSTPSITCPRCRKTSFSAKDVAERFCVRCGYHDDLPPEPRDARKGPPNLRAGQMRAALDRIARDSVADGWARKIARDALRKDDKFVAEERGA